jgi:hypothetical protein
MVWVFATYSFSTVTDIIVQHDQKLSIGVYDRLLLSRVDTVSSQGQTRGEPV